MSLEHLDLLFEVPTITRQLLFKTLIGVHNFIKSHFQLEILVNFGLQILIHLVSFLIELFVLNFQLLFDYSISYFFNIWLSFGDLFLQLGPQLLEILLELTFLLVDPANFFNGLVFRPEKSLEVRASKDDTLGYLLDDLFRDVLLA